MTRNTGSSITYTIFATTLLAGLVVVTVMHFQREQKEVRSDYIAQDVAQLADIFTAINETCSIISFDRVKNYIDFLNVVVFKGSEVGPMNLRYPEKWQGPYLVNNPTMQGVEYMVLATNSGHFVVPGEDVVLSNGKTVGTDIPLDDEESENDEKRTSNRLRKPPAVGGGEPGAGRIR